MITVIIGNVSSLVSHKGAVLLFSGCYNKFETLASNSKLIHSSGDTKTIASRLKPRTQDVVIKTIENTSLPSSSLRRYQHH
jgi:fumarate hydratase class II